MAEHAAAERGASRAARFAQAKFRPIYQKLGVTSRLEAIERALELRLL